MDNQFLSAEEEPDEGKAKGWGRLKAKFPFRRRRSSNDCAEDAGGADSAPVSDFLHSTGQNPAGRRFPGPMIDFSVVKEAERYSESNEPFKFTKPTRIVGLRVQFASALPEIIGEGGDEAEEPPIAVSTKTCHAPISMAAKLAKLEHREHIEQHPSSVEKDQNRSEFSPQAQAAPQPSYPIPGTHASPSRSLQADSVPKPVPQGLRRRPEALNSGDLRQRMRADEGRVFLSASPRMPNALHRKPVGPSASESSSRSPSPSRQHLSPPTSSHGGVSQQSQYPPAPVPSDARRPLHYYDRTFPEGGSLRPPSSGSETSSRSPSRGMKHRPNISNGSIESNLDYRGPDPSSTSRYVNRPKMLSSESQSMDGPTSHPLGSQPPTSGASTNTQRQPVENLAAQDRLFKESLHEFRLATSESPGTSGSAEVLYMPWRIVHVSRRKADDEEQFSIKIVSYDNQSSFADYSSRNRKFKLDRLQRNMITLHNNPIPPPSKTLAISINPRVHNPSIAPQLQKAQSFLRSVETVQSYDFLAQDAAHAFQSVVTGYAVLFDGMAQSFAISRRRMVVPIYKQHEANEARVQIVQGKGHTRLVAFFSDYSLAECLNIELKSFDVFEASETKDGLFCVKLVDAKFALPDPKTDKKPDFVSLDDAEYPSEHEDITIGFTDESMRDEFAAALPAEVTGPKKFTLKRRI